jgi:uncharacterized protein (TIGR03083 family)
VAADPVAALRAECELVSQTVIGLPEEEFAKPTRCTEWNVKQLLAHMFRDINRTNIALDEAPPPAADADSVSYWRSYDPATDSGDISARAEELAASFGSGQELAASWDEMWRRAAGRARIADRDRVVATWGPALTLDQFLRTRVLEMTVHRADLNDALGLPPDPTEEGLEITSEILLGLLDVPAASVPLKGLAFLEAGTCRRPLTENEREALGAAAGRFPMLA